MVCALSYNTVIAGHRLLYVTNINSRMYNIATMVRGVLIYMNMQNVSARPMQAWLPTVPNYYIIMTPVHV